MVTSGPVSSGHGRTRRRVPQDGTCGRRFCRGACRRRRLAWLAGRGRGQPAWAGGQGRALRVDGCAAVVQFVQVFFNRPQSVCDHALAVVDHRADRVGPPRQVHFCVPCGLVRIPRGPGPSLVQGSRLGMQRARRELASGSFASCQLEGRGRARLERKGGDSENSGTRQGPLERERHVQPTPTRGAWCRKRGGAALGRAFGLGHRASAPRALCQTSTTR